MTEKQREKALNQFFSAIFEDQGGKHVSDEIDSSDVENADEENPHSIDNLSMLLKKCGLWVKSWLLWKATYVLLEVLGW